MAACSALPQLASTLLSAEAASVLVCVEASVRALPAALLGAAPASAALCEVVAALARAAAGEDGATGGGGGGEAGGVAEGALVLLLEGGVVRRLVVEGAAGSAVGAAAGWRAAVDALVGAADRAAAAAARRGCSRPASAVREGALAARVAADTIAACGGGGASARVNAAAELLGRLAARGNSREVARALREAPETAPRILAAMPSVAAATRVLTAAIAAIAPQNAASSEAVTAASARELRSLLGTPTPGAFLCAGAMMEDLHAYVVDELLVGGRLRAGALRLALEVAATGPMAAGGGDAKRSLSDQRALQRAASALSEAWATHGVASAMQEVPHARVSAALAVCLAAGGADAARAQLPSVFVGVQARLEAADPTRRRAGMRLATLAAALAEARGDGEAPEVFESEKPLTPSRLREALWDVEWWGGREGDPGIASDADPPAAPQVPSPTTAGRRKEKDGGVAPAARTVVGFDPAAPADFFASASGAALGVTLESDSEAEDGAGADGGGYDSESSLEGYALSDEEDARPIETLEERGVRKAAPVTLAQLVALLREGGKDPYALEAALRGAEALIRSRPAELSGGAAQELALALLTTRPTIDDGTWGGEGREGEAATGGEHARRAALMAILVTCPEACVEEVAARLASPHLDAAQRFAMLDAMEGAAREISGVFAAASASASRTRADKAAIQATGAEVLAATGADGEDARTADGRPRVRRWGHRAAAARAASDAKRPRRNAFGPLAPLFALPLLAAFDRGEARTGADLLHAPNAPVLARLLLALGSFAECAGHAPQAVPVAAAVLELLMVDAVGGSADVGVARAALAAQALAVRALPPPVVAAALEGGGELGSLLEAAAARASVAAAGDGPAGADEAVRVLGAHSIEVQRELLGTVAGPAAPGVESMTIRMPSLSALS